MIVAKIEDRRGKIEISNELHSQTSRIYNGPTTRYYKVQSTIEE